MYKLNHAKTQVYCTAIDLWIKILQLFHLQIFLQIVGINLLGLIIKIDLFLNCNNMVSFK